MTNGLTKLLAPDQSYRDWLQRHGMYWLSLMLIVATSWVYWTHSFQEAVAGALFNMVFRYMPATYLFLYYVLPKLMQEHYRAAAVRLLIWLIVSVALRFVLLYNLPTNLLQYCLSRSLADTVVPDTSLRQLFSPSFMVTNSLVIVAASLKLFRYQYQKAQANQQLARETLSIELRMLQAQVQPHFLFNTLNNIYSLTLRRSAKASEVVKKLSSLLGYMFQECDVPEVLLSQEVALLRNYTELEQLRYGHRLVVTMQTGGALANKRIAPLLLIPFVENAFKHGASEQTDQAAIDLKLLVTDNLLTFSIVNTTNSHVIHQETKPGGLGLQNVRKRLALLYPNQHTLKTRAEANRYIVELTIQLTPVQASTLPKPTSQRPVPIPDYHPQTV